MRRIGIDCRLWNETGVGRYIRNLVKELALFDHDTEYTLFFGKEVFESFTLPGRSFKKRLADVRWHTLSEQTQFKKIVENESLDLVHFPYFSYPVGYNGKFVITIHDLIIDHFSTGKASTLPGLAYFIKRLGYQFILKRAIHNARKVIAVSGSTKQEIIDHYHADPSNVVVTYEGIDTNISPKNQEKIDVRSPYFFSVGNSYPHKNLERLVDAFVLVVQKNPDAHFVFVGKEDYFSKRLEQYVSEKNLLKNMSFYKTVSDNQLAYLYAHAVALVAPSLMEGFGLPALEAMANNCFVLASEIPAFLEVCGDAAVYFDPYNVEDIAKTLSMAYNHRINNIASKKKQGMVRAKEFSWKKMAKETKAVYDSCF